MAKQFTWPQWLERTPDQLAEEAQVQDLRRASFGRGHLTPEELLIGRGALLEETARGNLAAGETDISQSQLAHALAMQGRYAESAEHAPDAAMKAHFEAITAAIDMGDSEKCNCEDFTGTVDGVDVSITPRFVAQQIFSRKHGKLVSLVTCARCGHANARELRGRLLLAKTKQNLAAANDQGRGQVRDSQVLRAQ